jgi:hypothetical protein
MYLIIITAFKTSIKLNQFNPHTRTHTFKSFSSTIVSRLTMVLLLLLLEMKLALRQLSEFKVTNSTLQGYFINRDLVYLRTVMCAVIFEDWGECCDDWVVCGTM